MRLISEYFWDVEIGEINGSNQKKLPLLFGI
jgi:hypothetical protein